MSFQELFTFKMYNGMMTEHVSVYINIISKIPT